MATNQEEKARDNGWVPKEEWVEAGKDESDWVDAREFNYRGELMGRISHQTKELKRLQESQAQRDARIERLSEALQALGEQNKRLAKKRIEEERKELRGIRAEAELEKDAATLAEVDEDLKKLDEAEKELDIQDTSSKAPNEPQDGEATIDPEQQAYWAQWVRDNPWYITDPQMQSYANFVAQTIPREGLSFEDYLESVKEAVSGVFQLDEGDDDEAPKKKASPRRAVMDTSPTGNSGGRRGGKSAVAKLTEDERRIGQTYVDEGLFKSLDEYAKQLQELEG